MSMSFVIVGEPQSRPATPPMITKRTSWCKRVRSAPTGSNGMSADPARPAQPLQDRRFFDERHNPLGRGEAYQHPDLGAVDAYTPSGNRFERFAAGFKEPLDRADPRVVLAPLDSGDRRLGDAAVCGESPLRQTSPASGLAHGTSEIHV